MPSSGHSGHYNGVLFWTPKLHHKDVLLKGLDLLALLFYQVHSFTPHERKSDQRLAAHKIHNNKNTDLHSSNHGKVKQK